MKVSIQEGSINNILTLWAAPKVQSDESLSSWIQRICGSHQYSMPRIISILKFNPVLRDWDLPIPSENWDNLRLITRLGVMSEWTSLLTLSSIYKHIHPTQFRWADGKFPSYSWCSTCLSTDDIPYLRWYWRLAAVEVCPVHREKMSNICPTCSKPLILNTSRLVQLGAYGNAGDLRDCAFCGLPLVGQSFLLAGKKRKHRVYRGRVKSSLESLLEDLRFVQNFTDAATTDRALKYFVTGLPSKRSHVASSHFLKLELAKGKEPYPYRFYQEGLDSSEVQELRRAYEKAWLRHRQYRFRISHLSKQKTSLIDGCLDPIPEPKIHWSWRLEPDKRVQLAKAIHLFRKEKRENNVVRSSA